MKKFRRFSSMAAALIISAGMLPSALPVAETANAAYGAGGTGKNIVEYLDRGISAINTGSGMLVSWRYLANDSDTAEFRLYRDNNLIYTNACIIVQISFKIINQTFCNNSIILTYCIIGFT